MVCPCLNSRWVISRIRRMLFGCTFLCIAFTTVVSIFIVLNRTTNQEKVSHIVSYFSKFSNSEEQQGSFPRTQRPMAQFYPDNQQTHLYRKLPESPNSFKVIQAQEYEPNSRNGDHKDKNNYENVLKSKLRIAQNMNDNIQKSTVKTNKTNSTTKPSVQENVAYNVHVFYYAWYANPVFDDRWLHWNHEYIENWNKQDPRTYPSGVHNPDKDDIGSNFFPELGCYSSADDNVILNHMFQIRKSGAGVLVLSWYPPSTADEHGKPVDRLLPKLLDAANTYNLKIALHVEPYHNRSAVTLRRDLEYVAKTYSSHPAFYKVKLPGRLKPVPMYYIYDSYLTSGNEWSRLFSRTGDLSIRGTDLDGIFLALLVEFKHRTDIKNGGFDGFYTYFAANGFSHGSSWKNWRNLNMFSKVLIYQIQNLVIPRTLYNSITYHLISL